VSTSKQTGEREAHLFLLPENDLTDLLNNGIEARAFN
jgi:hypothetical protein